MFKPKGITVLLTYDLPGSKPDQWTEVSITRQFPAVPRVGDRIWLNNVKPFPGHSRVKDIIWQVNEIGLPIPELVLTEWPIKTEVE